MLLRRHTKNPRLLVQVGLFSLAAGALTLHHGTRMGLPPEIAAGLGGLFYGIAIPSMLMAIYVQCRGRGNGGSGSA